MKYKVGDRVKVKSAEKLKEFYDNSTLKRGFVERFVNKMSGGSFTITTVDDDYTFPYSDDTSIWSLCDDDIEELVVQDEPKRFQVGQVWRTRSGNKATIIVTDLKSNRPIGAIIHDPANPDRFDYLDQYHPDGTITGEPTHYNDLVSPWIDDIVQYVILSGIDGSIRQTTKSKHHIEFDRFNQIKLVYRIDHDGNLLNAEATPIPRKP